MRTGQHRQPAGSRDRPASLRRHWLGHALHPAWRRPCSVAGLPPSPDRPRPRRLPAAAHRCRRNVPAGSANPAQRPAAPPRLPAGSADHASAAWRPYDGACHGRPRARPAAVLASWRSALHCGRRVPPAAEAAAGAWPAVHGYAPVPVRPTGARPRHRAGPGHRAGRHRPAGAGSRPRPGRARAWRCSRPGCRLSAAAAPGAAAATSQPARPTVAPIGPPPARAGPGAGPAGSRSGSATAPSAGRWQRPRTRASLPPGSVRRARHRRTAAQPPPGRGARRHAGTPTARRPRSRKQGRAQPSSVTPKVWGNDSGRQSTPVGLAPTDTSCCRLCTAPRSRRGKLRQAAEFTLFQQCFTLKLLILNSF